MRSFGRALAGPRGWCARSRCQKHGDRIGIIQAKGADMAIEARPRGQVISTRTPLLSVGRTTNIVAQGELLHVAVKVYAEGGENALHAHAADDHLHFVLDGEATFYDEDGNTTVVHKNEGMFL